MSDARKRAEGALEEHDVAVAGDEWAVAPISLALADALRALLAETAPHETFEGHPHDASCRECWPAPPQAREVEEAARALRAKMRAVYDDARYMNVWATAQERLGPYTGPTWIAEAEALDAALARGGA